MKAATVYEFEDAGAHAMADISPHPAPAMPHPPTTSISPTPSLVFPRRKSCSISYKVYFVFCLSELDALLTLKICISLVFLRISIRLRK